MALNKEVIEKIKEKYPDIELGNLKELIELSFDKEAYDINKKVLSHERHGWGFLDSDNNLYFKIHGTVDGQMAGYGAYLRPQDLGLILKNANLIDSNVKNIYTISCYGGLQKPFKMDNGISVRSSHTSEEPVMGAYGGNKERLITSDGGLLIPETKNGLGNTKEITVAISPDMFDEASKQYLASLPKLTHEEAKELYVYNDRLQIGVPSYHYSRGQTKEEYLGLLNDKLNELEDNLKILELDPEKNEQQIERIKYDIEKIQKYKNEKYNIGRRRLGDEEQIIAKRYKDETLYKDWEKLSPEEKYEKYKNDYTKYKEERRQQWEERKRLEQKLKEETPNNISDSYDLEFDKKRLSRKHKNINLDLINEKFEQLVQKDKRFLDYVSTVDSRLEALVKDTLGIQFDKNGLLQKGDFSFTGSIFSKHTTLSNTYYIDRVTGKKFAPKFEELKKLLTELGFEHIQLDDQYKNPVTNNRDKDYWGERGFKNSENNGDVGRLRTLDLVSNEETTVIIEDDNSSIKTETSSTENTNIPDSSKNQNNAEKTKNEEPISNPDNPTPNPDTNSSAFFDTSQYSNDQISRLKRAGLIEEVYANDGKGKTYKKYRKTDKFTDELVEQTLRPHQNSFDPNKINKDRQSFGNTKPNKPDINTKPNTNSEKPESKPPETPKKGRKPTKGPKVNSSNITKEQVEKVAKQAKMKMKNLANDATKAISEGINWSKVGKVGAIAGTVALVGYGIHKHNEKEKENRKYGPDRLTGSLRKSEFWNQSYTAQMAKDISTYQYGKRMTGFVQG